MKILGLLYGPAHSFFYLADDVESGLNWCEKQCKDNEDELISERASRQVAGMSQPLFLPYILHSFTF